MDELRNMSSFENMHQIDESGVDDIIKPKTQHHNKSSKNNSYEIADIIAEEFNPSLPHIKEHEALYEIKNSFLRESTQKADMIFVTPFLPLELTSLCKISKSAGNSPGKPIGIDFDDDLENEESVDEALHIKLKENFSLIGYSFYYVRKVLHKTKKFPWIGWVVFDQSEELKQKMKAKIIEEFSYWPVFITKHEFDIVYKSIWRGYLNKVFSVNYANERDQHSFHPMFNLKDNWEVYLRICKRLINEILLCQETMGFERTASTSLVVLNGMLCLMMPSLLSQMKIKLNLGFYFSSSFPCHNHLKKIQNYREVVRGLLACDVIFFDFHQQASHFIKILKDLFFLGMDFELNGYISAMYKGRKIYIRVLSKGVHNKRIGTTKLTKEKVRLRESLQLRYGGQVKIMSIEEEDLMSLNLKFNIYDFFLKKYKDKLEKSTVLMIIVDVDIILEPKGLKLITDRVKDIKKRHGENSIKIEFTKIQRYQKWAYMEITDIYLEVCTRDRLNLYCLEFSLLKNDGKMMIDSNTSLNSFFSESISQENPLNLFKFAEKLKKLVDSVSGASPKISPNSKHEKRVMLSESQTIYNIELWWKYMVADLLKASSELANSNILFKHNHDLIATHKRFQRVDLVEVWAKLIKRTGFLIIDFDAVYLAKLKNEAFVYLKATRHKKKVKQNQSKALKRPIQKELKQFCACMIKLVKSTDFKILITTQVTSKDAENLFKSLAAHPNIYLLAENGNAFAAPKKQRWAWRTRIEGETKWHKQVRKLVKSYTERYAFISANFMDASISIMLLEIGSEIGKDIYDQMIREVKAVRTRSNSLPGFGRFEVVEFDQRVIVKDKRLNMANCMINFLKDVVGDGEELEMAILLGGSSMEPAFRFMAENSHKMFDFEDLELYCICETLRVSQADYYIEAEDFKRFVKGLSKG